MAVNRKSGRRSTVRFKPIGQAVKFLEIIEKNSQRKMQKTTMLRLGRPIQWAIAFVELALTLSARTKNYSKVLGALIMTQRLS